MPTDAPQSPLVTFGIPLKPRTDEATWSHVQRLLERTVASIYRQGDRDFEIVIAYTDQPVLDIPTDERLSFLKMPRVPTGDYRAATRDAELKRGAIARRVAARGGYLMFVDADDLVSDWIVAHVRQTRDPNGYALWHGYVLDAQSLLMAPLPAAADWAEPFHRCCGSSIILHLTPEDIAPGGSDRRSRFWSLYENGHYEAASRAQAAGRPLAAMPFPAAIYVVNHGDNVYDRRPAGHGKPSALIASCAAGGAQAQGVTDEVRGEFGVPLGFPVWRGPSAATLSIAIATHKRPEGLRRLLEALVPQVDGFSGREILVLNDGSHDPAYDAVIADFAGKLTYIVGEANLGVAAVRHALCRRAAGDYVVITDDDCVPPPWWLDWLAARLADAPELDVIAGICKPLWPARRSFFARVQAQFRFYPMPDRTPDGVRFVTANVAIRRSLVAQLDGFAGHVPATGAGEDTKLSLRLVRGGARAEIDSNWYVHHEVGDGFRNNLRRYWRYGYANAVMLDSTASYSVHMPLREATWRRLPRLWWKEFRQLHREAGGFSRYRLPRWAAAFAASLLRLAYLAGGAAACREALRRE
jgi:glycosyltransferase involved in cell wall biosynthesis